MVVLLSTVLQEKCWGLQVYFGDLDTFFLLWHYTSSSVASQGVKIIMDLWWACYLIYLCKPN